MMVEVMVVVVVVSLQNIILILLFSDLTIVESDDDEEEETITDVSTDSEVEVEDSNMKQKNSRRLSGKFSGITDLLNRSKQGGNIMINIIRKHKIIEN